MKFNLNSGAVKAKTQIARINEGINYYEYTETPIPSPLPIYAKDYQLLMKKATDYLRKNKHSTTGITLFFDEHELSST